MKVEQRPTTSPSKGSLSDKETLLKLYREMLLIRRFEEKTAEMYQAQDRRLLPPQHRRGGNHCRFHLRITAERLRLQHLP